MKKKLYVMLMVAVLAVSVVACGGKNSEESTPSTEISQETETQEESGEESKEENVEESTEESSAETTEENTEESTEEATGDTFGAMMTEKFHTEIADNTDLLEVLVNTTSVMNLNFDQFEVTNETEYFIGFDSKIPEFKKGYCVAPFISTQPFISYIFEVEDAESFKEELKSLANPSWNICTTADEVICESEGNIVFFAMCPAKF